MRMATNNDLAMLLGEIKAGVERLREDFSDEKVLSKENRTIIHKRLDEQAEKVTKIEAGFETMQRDIEEVKSALSVHQAEITPTIAEWKRLKIMGMTISGMIALAGLSLGTLIATASDLVVAWIRHWLKIGG